MALVKALKPLQVVSIILFVRILSVFLVQTWFVADEYWQTLEVAHKQVFGYGAHTWEWDKGIRSYLYPSVVAALYWVLKVTGLDCPEAVVLVPRIFQAIVSTAADYSFYKWTGGRKWALFLVLTSWFWFYTSGRTLLQTLEAALVAVALSVFPFKDGKFSYYDKEDTKWILLACVCVFLRPTSAPLWIVLAGYNLATTSQPRLRLILQAYLPIGLATAAAMIALDSVCHGSLIVTPWEFVRFNVLHDIASFYGQHPWHWYLTQGLPAVLGVNLIPVLIATYSILRRPKENKVGLLLLAAVALHVTLYSFIPHKEFRFVLPLLPILLYLAQDVIVRWSRKATKWQLYLTAGLILVGNAVPALYFGLIHQSGTLKVMPLLRESFPDNRTSVLFMMPCHSTPLYSHLHTNVTTRHLNCDPPFNKVGETYESEYFFNNPQRWWRAEYTNKQPPTFVVLFDKLLGRVESALAGYRELYRVPHTQCPDICVNRYSVPISHVWLGFGCEFPEGEVSENVLVFKKKSRPTTEADAAV